MGLAICSVTVREVAGDSNPFPAAIRDLLCKAVSAISAEELQELMDKHESDPGRRTDEDSHNFLSYRWA